MNTPLELRLFNPEVTERGKEADAEFTEPNGDKLIVRCLCLPDGRIEIGEQTGSHTMIYLSNRYGPDTISNLRKEVIRACG